MSFCWQCYAPYGRGAVPQPASVGTTEGGASAGPLAAGGTSSGQVAAGPLARVGGSTVSDALRGPSATGTTSVPPVSTGRSWVGSVVKVVVFLAFAVGAFLAWRHFFAGFSFPDGVAGQPRVETDATDEATELISGLTRSLGAELEMAFYGDGASPQPSYVVYVITLPEDSPLVAVPGDPLGELMSGDMACTPNVQGSNCTWLEGEDRVVGVAGYGLAPEEVRPVAREVRADLAD
jgi:hypothetical protein